jgi:hypothetical protein
LSAEAPPVPFVVPRAANEPAKTWLLWTARPLLCVQFERPPDSNPSWNRTPVVGVVAVASLLGSERFS